MKIATLTCGNRIRMGNKNQWGGNLFFIVGLSLICGLIINVPAQSGEEANEDTAAWIAKEAVPKKFDWIQLTSGEWLKGDLKVLYNDSLDFDSKKLDLLTFDWKDIQQIRCHAPQSLLIQPSGPAAEGTDRSSWTRTVVGILQVKGEKVFVDTGEETLEFDRSALISIASGERKELDYWSAKLTLSLDVMQGNTDQINYGTYVNAMRRTTYSRFYMDYRGNINYSEGVETSNNQRINSYYDIFKTKKFFLRPVFAEYYHDPFANIAQQGTIGTGVGYSIIDTATTELLIGPGVAYQQTRYDSTEPGEAGTISTPALVVYSEFDTDLTKTIDYNLQYKFYVVNKASGSYSHHFVTGLEINLTGHLELDLSLVWNRTKDPQPASDGTVPEQDDVHFYCGIAFEL